MSAPQVDDRKDEPRRLQGALFRGQLYLAIKDVQDTQRQNLVREFEEKLETSSTEAVDDFFLINMFR